jgi:redox-sensitive bicupin YhaK (pirin superfamily)
MNTQRTLVRVIRAVPASDGAGVKLMRSLGQGPHARVDPFLMLDHFSSENPDDYVAGFPSHPHRGFETVTYMLDGHMLHEDHLGHRGHLKSGGVQWMTAGRGIVHSEMPQQERGRMRGFQLWINLPAREKMKPASYRDLDASEIPEVALPEGGVARVVAGVVDVDGERTQGPIVGIATEPVYLDVRLPAGGRFAQPLPDGHNAFVYPYEGSLSLAGRELPTHSAGVLATQGDVVVDAGGGGARFLLLAARPLHEPVVQWGPFVMNTSDEIEQAIRDYQSGTLARG